MNLSINWMTLKESLKSIDQTFRVCSPSHYVYPKTHEPTSKNYTSPLSQLNTPVISGEIFKRGWEGRSEDKKITLESLLQLSPCSCNGFLFPADNFHLWSFKYKIYKACGQFAVCSRSYSSISLCVMREKKKNSTAKSPLLQHAQR